MSDAGISIEDVERQTAALEGLEAELRRDRRTLVHVGIAFVVLLIAVGSIGWGNRTIGTRTERIARISRQAQIGQTCTSEALRAFPALLTDPAELQKAIKWTADCRKLNDVEIPVIKLPPKQ